MGGVLCFLGVPVNHQQVVCTRATFGSTFFVLGAWGLKPYGSHSQHRLRVLFWFAFPGVQSRHTHFVLLAAVVIFLCPLETQVCPNPSTDLRISGRLLNLPKSKQNSPQFHSTTLILLSPYVVLVQPLNGETPLARCLQMHLFANTGG